MDSVELLAPKPSKYFKYGTIISQGLARNCAITINPGIPKIKLNNKYDVFFAFCQFPKDLIHVDSIVGWKDHCKTSICWVSELWISEIDNYKTYLKILSKFDHVILHWSQSVKTINEVIGGKAFFSPLGIDAILFCPYPNPPQRLIDVYSIGRRSEKTHRSLMKMTEGNKFFYVYDSIIGDVVMDINQHRSLFANLAKRSRYFIVNPGKIDVPDETKSQSEIGNRYYEGAAAGNIMIGEHPKNEEFKKIFYWPDAVVHVPFSSDKIDEIINELDQQPQRLENIRRKNVMESLMRHDWAYRWETILKAAGLEPMPGLLERKKQLENLLKLAEKEKNDL
jgi:hypothetical protein